MHVLSARRQRRTDLSPLPEASVAPSGVQARALTQLVCPFRTAVHVLSACGRGPGGWGWLMGRCYVIISLAVCTVTLRERSELQLAAGAPQARSGAPFFWRASCILARSGAACFGAGKARLRLTAMAEGRVRERLQLIAREMSSQLQL